MARLPRNTPAGRRQASRAAHVATIPRNTVAPAITGTAQAGQTLTVTNGTWAGNSATYTRQWKRGATNVGAGGLTYVVQAGDVGSVITCVVTATNSTGAVSATSNATATVIAAGLTPGAEMLTNGAFGSATGWTLAAFNGTASIAGGTLTINDPEGESPRADQVLSALAAGWYRVAITVVSADGNPAAHCFVSLDSEVAFNFVGTDTGTFTIDVHLLSVSGKVFRIAGDQTAGAWVFDNASVKPLT